MAKVNLVTQSEYAKHRGCSAVAVHKAIAAGRISLIDGKIDPVVADLQWKANTRARVAATVVAPPEPAAATAPDDLVSQAEGATAPSLPDAEPAERSVYAASRGRREAADAEMAELNLAKQRRELISVAVVEGVWSASLAAAREHLLQIRARLAPLLAAETDVFKVEQMLETEHRQALELLAAAEVRKAEGAA